MRFFKPRRLCIAAILLAGVGVCWWLVYERAPVMRFAGFKDENKDLAVFRVQNPSNIRYRVIMEEWSRWDGSEWENVAKAYYPVTRSQPGPLRPIVAPQSGCTLERTLPHMVESGDRVKLAIIIYVENESTLNGSSQQDGFIARFLNWLGVRRSGVITVWSDVVVVE